MDFPSSAESTTSQTSSSPKVANCPFPPKHNTLPHANSPCSNPSPLSYDFRLHTVTVSENPYKIFIYEQPTAEDERLSYMSLSKVFILNDEFCFRWKTIGVDYGETDGNYVVYTAQGMGFDTSIKVMVPRRWG